MRTIRVYAITFLMVMGLILLALPSQGQMPPIIIEINFVTILVDDFGNLCSIDAHPSRDYAGSEPKLEVSAGMDVASLLTDLTFRGIMPQRQAFDRAISPCILNDAKPRD